MQEQIIMRENERIRDTRTNYYERELEIQEWERDEWEWEN